MKVRNSRHHPLREKREIKGAATILRDDTATTISDSGRNASRVDSYSRPLKMMKRIPAVDAARVLLLNFKAANPVICKGQKT
ncbi:hypothetical protein TNIN_364291 [Trichonephila inaurata madagascariensis]|uniref:Uncharacterized protein n=1 Tax=Trichonephila inaurata madagascariensis TaxID=2747483 RepID=A0A8X6X1I6_9ARAC|nr:hypothetical protein TNIN_364291 [Trichonephila inaurata madagascariensis]